MDVSGVTSFLPSTADTRGSLHNRHVEHFAVWGIYADFLNASLPAVSLLLARLAGSCLASGRF